MMRGDAIGTDLDAIDKDLNSRFEWIWYKDLEGHVNEALAELHNIQWQESYKEHLQSGIESSPIMC